MMANQLPAIIAAPIETIEQGKAWIEALHAADCLFHFEDSPADIIDEKDEPLFSPEQAALIGNQVDALYALEWGEWECPIGYALHVLGLK